MSRKPRKTQKNFKVFCEGSTEYHYIDAMRRQQENLQKLLVFCKRQNKYGKIPHFLIVTYPDFEYIACLHIPKYKGQNTTQYLIRELGYQSIDAFKADEKIYHILNTNGNSYERILPLLKGKNCFVINNYSINEKQYEINISATTCDWKKLGQKGSNIYEFFDVIKRFYT